MGNMTANKHDYIPSSKTSFTKSGEGRGVGVGAGFDPWALVSQPLVSAAAAAAKSRQSCPTLCDPIDGSPPGSPSLGFSRQEHWSGLPFPSPMHESEK